MHVAAPQTAMAPMAAPQEEDLQPDTNVSADEDVFESTRAPRQWAFINAASVFPANDPENLGDGMDGMRAAKNAMSRFAQAEYRCLCPCFCG